MKVYFIGILLFLLGCQPNDKTSQSIAIPVSVGIDQTITNQIQYASLGFTKLSDYGFFEGRLADLSPSKDVFPYVLNTPLFSDYAEKKRFIYLPSGTKIGYREKQVLDFPVETVLIKNFFYTSTQMKTGSLKILETRLLIRESDEWKALPYIWNQEQTEAYLEITGGKMPVEIKNHGMINYTIPDMNQCKSCHDKGGKMIPIGPSVRQLNRISELGEGNQLNLLSRRGWLDLPEGLLPKLAVWNDEKSGTLDERARSYLDINCAHCHSDEGPAKNSGLNLTIFETDSYRLGINKKPVAAGRGSGNLKFGIVPGHPEASILVHRMSTQEPGTMMPELGRTVPHDEGLALIKAWIEHL